MKLFKFFILVILLVFPFGELLRFDIGNNIIVKPLDVVVLVTVITYFIFLSSRLKWRDLSPQRLLQKILRLRYRSAQNDKVIVIALVMFVMIGFLSLILNSSWLSLPAYLASFLYLVRWACYSGLLFVVMKFDHQFKKKIQKILFIDGLIIVILGYLQLLFYPSLKGLYSFGWDDHMYRMFSVFLDPNFAGAFFVCYFIFIAGMLHISFRVKRSEVLGMTKQPFFLFLILFITLGAIFLTYSRSALLMLLVSSAVFLVLIKKKKLLFLLVGIMLAFTFSISSFFYIENINLFREASSNARLDNYSAAFTIISDRPVFGIGFNAYRYAKDLYGIPSGWASTPSHADAGVDNSFLFILATTGIVGFVVYCFLWFHILQKAWIAFYERKDILGAVIFSSSIGLFVNALFINSLFFPAMLLWLWVMVGLLKK